jgi:Uma2 family endonuclease
MVVCDSDDDGVYVKHKPCLIIEILSESTEAIDRGEKLGNYTLAESLQAYVLVSQQEAKVEIYRRDENGWHYHVLRAKDTLKLPCVQLELPVETLYTNL